MACSSTPTTACSHREPTVLTASGLVRYYPTEAIISRKGRKHYRVPVRSQYVPRHRWQPPWHPTCNMVHLTDSPFL